MTTPELALKHIKVTGEVSITPVTGQATPDAYWYLLIGPTGAGKSSFIQALAGGSVDLGIAKDQLASVTQSVIAYQLVNVVFPNPESGKDMPIFIVDTPGFSDIKLSDAGIFIELGKAVARKDVSVANTILFVMPITETRLSGSKRRTIRLLQTMLGPPEDENTVSMTVVTTMWDTVYTERARKRAESNFAQLIDEIFKDFTKAGATISQFMNTRNSALQMLDMSSWVPRGSRPSSTDFNAISPHLFRDVYIHLEAAIQEKQNIESQLSQQEAQTIPTLKAVLESNQKEAQEVLEGLFEQMRRLGLPPPGLEPVHRAFLKRVVGAHVPRTFPVRFYVFICFVSRLVRAAKRRRDKKVVELTLDASLLRLS